MTLGAFPRNRTIATRPRSLLPVAMLTAVSGIVAVVEAISGHWFWMAGAAAGTICWALLSNDRSRSRVELRENGLSYCGVGGSGQLNYSEIGSVMRARTSRSGVGIGLVTRSGEVVRVAANLRVAQADELVAAVDAALNAGRRRPVLGIERRTLGHPPVLVQPERPIPTGGRDHQFVDDQTTDPLQTDHLLTDGLLTDGLLTDGPDSEQVGASA